MQMVECRTLDNKIKRVPAESLEIRPSVYGLIVHEGRILLVRHTPTGKYILPGGGIDKGEPILTALKREIWEETGITVEVGRFLNFAEDFFYYEPLETGSHGYFFFYECHPLTIVLPAVEYPPEEALDGALWVELASLEPASFLRRGPVMMQIIRQLTGIA
ncbi:NUDIX domain-containing protein [Chloroflexota bacterium]